MYSSRKQLMSRLNAPKDQESLNQKIDDVIRGMQHIKTACSDWWTVDGGSLVTYAKYDRIRTQNLELKVENNRLRELLDIKLKS